MNLKEVAEACEQFLVVWRDQHAEAQVFSPAIIRLRNAVGSNASNESLDLRSVSDSATDSV